MDGLVDSDNEAEQTSPAKRSAGSRAGGEFAVHFVHLSFDAVSLMGSGERRCRRG